MDFIQETQGTLIGRVLSVMASGIFVESPTDPVGEGETPIGELSSFEKALITVDKAIADEHNEKVKNHFVGIADAEEKAKQNYDDHEILKWFLWNSVRARIGATAQKKNENRAIRVGYQIVSFVDNELGRLTGLLDELLGPPEKHNSLSSYSPNCAKCNDYDECELSIKIPR